MPKPPKGAKGFLNFTKDFSKFGLIGGYPKLYFSSCFSKASERIKEYSRLTETCEIICQLCYVFSCEKIFNFDV